MSANAEAMTYSTTVEDATKTVARGIFLLNPASPNQTSNAHLYVHELMDQGEAAIGYRSLSKLNKDLAEKVLPAASESWPNW